MVISTASPIAVISTASPTAAVGAVVGGVQICSFNSSCSCCSIVSYQICSSLPSRGSIIIIIIIIGHFVGSLCVHRFGCCSCSDICSIEIITVRVGVRGCSDFNNRGIGSVCPAHSPAPIIIESGSGSHASQQVAAFAVAVGAKARTVRAFIPTIAAFAVAVRAFARSTVFAVSTVVACAVAEARATTFVTGAVALLPILVLQPTHHLSVEEPLLWATINRQEGPVHMGPWNFWGDGGLTGLTLFREFFGRLPSTTGLTLVLDKHVSAFGILLSWI